MKTVQAWCVRAADGTHARRFVDGGFAAIGLAIKESIASVTTREEAIRLYRHYNPSVHNAQAIGLRAGQIVNFMTMAERGHLILTPDRDGRSIWVGRLDGRSDYTFIENPTDGCPFEHRRAVTWRAEPVLRADLPDFVRSTMTCPLAFFKAGLWPDPPP